MQFMKNVKIINYMKRSAWMFPCSITPFENGQRFLHENQIKPVGRKSVEPPVNNNHTIKSNYCHWPTSRYSYLIGELFDESCLREIFKKSFDVDNLGSCLNEHKSVSDNDKAKIKEI